MTKFSNLIDISSFFIGVLINLLLIAMICFYFKRKIDNLELSQSEQAKMLYKIISDNGSQTCLVNDNDKQNVSFDQTKLNFINGLDLNELEDTENEEEKELNNNEEPTQIKDDDDDDDDDDEEEESDSEDEEDDDDDESSVQTETDEHELISESLTDMIEDVDQMKEILQNQEPKVITITEDDANNTDYEKLTVKELKQLLATQGVEVSKKNAKKQELIDMVKNNTGTIVVSKENNEIENVVNIHDIEEIEDINNIN